MRLLLISNSTNPGEPYLDYPKHEIKKFLGDKPINALFIPYAGITFSHDEYEEKVNNRFLDINHKVTSIHHFDNPIEAIENAEAIIVGGGNTWHMVKTLQDKGLMEVIKKKVESGTPYIGWSAGSNIACPTLKTTNDMPISEPKSFNTLNLVPFQINPHYLDAHPENHGGETREMRIEEFMVVNQNTYVVGLREGTMLLIENSKMKMIGNRTARIFKYGQDPIELSSKDDFTYLLSTK
ncbi:MAG: dipeptidase PepE [Proteiniphilum sp.]|nr:dipeptidase PepE [Proteiniphilum sp.]